MKSYRRHRAAIKDGDVIAWKGTGFFSWVIRTFTRSPWTHVGIALWWGTRLMVLDSYIGQGTRAMLLSHISKDAYWLPSGANWTREAHEFALDELHKKYSLQNLWKTWLGLALVKQEYHCAQYVATVLEKAGVSLSMPPTPESVVKELGSEPTALGLEYV